MFDKLTGELLSKTDFKTDSFGLEFNRQMITGEWDDLYKGLIEMFEGQHIFRKHLKGYYSIFGNQSFSALFFVDTGAIHRRGKA